MNSESFWQDFARFTLGKRIVAVHIHAWADDSFDLRFDDGSILEVHLCHSRPQWLPQAHLGFGLVPAEYIAEFTDRSEDYWPPGGRTYWSRDG